MNRKRGMTIAAAITLSMAMSTAAFAAPSDLYGHWAQGTITQWTNKGYISGYPDGTFKPDNSISRAEFVVLVNKAMGYSKKGTAYFRDLNSSFWGYDEIMKGVSAGYIKGDADGSFRPNDPVRRQEAAVMMAQILGLGTNSTGAAKYTDYRYIPSWAAGYIGAVSNAGLMAGYPDGDFKPDRVLTRAEAVIALNNVLNYDGKTDDNTGTQKEDYTLEKTSLKDKVITGDLIISSSLSSKSISLEDVTVEGRLIVKGGGTITAEDCDINELVMNKTDATFKAEGKTKVKSTKFEKVGKIVGKGFTDVTVDNELSGTITIDAEIKNFELDAETDIKLLSGTDISSFTATKNADRATINFNNADVDEMYVYDKIRITGKGDIGTMTVYVDGVTSSIKPDTVKTKNGAEKPKYTSSSGSSSGSSSSRYDDLTVTKDGKKIKDGKYDDVTVRADDVIFDGTVIYGDLTIHKDVGNGTVTFEDVTVHGNVYIYGGGSRSVDFDDCDIRKDIIVDKANVRLNLEGTTDVDGKIIVKDNATVNSDAKLGTVTVNVKGVKLSLNANAAYVNMDSKDGTLIIGNGYVIDNVTVNAEAEIKMGGSNAVIKTLKANEDVNVTGTGTIETKTGSGTMTKADTIQLGVSVTGVTLDKTTASMEKGSKLQLKATVNPSNATNKEVEWSSSDTAIASVSNTGEITAHEVGTAEITVKTKDGSKTAKCTVTVTNATVPATEIELNKTELTLTVGGNETLTATVTPDNTTDSVEWTSSNTAIATVDNSGKVTAVAEGTATITAKAGEKSAACNVTVEAAKPEFVAVTDITGIPDEITAGENVTLSATITPDNATNKEVTFTVKEAETTGASISGNTLTTTKDGTLTITATVANGAGESSDFTKDFTITVNPATVAVTGVTLDKTTATVNVGDTTQLNATVNPTDATNKNVTWSTSDGNVATVNNNGIVTGVKSGTATITVTTEDGSKTANCEVTVSNIDVSNITLSESTLNLVFDDDSQKTATLTATVTPTNATDTTVTWTSSNAAVAEVANGVVTAKSAGTATITARAGSRETTCTVTVTAKTVAVENVSVSPTTLELTVGGSTGSLTAIVTPENATDKTVTWTSSNTDVATVNNGTVTAVGVGTATITATVNGKTANCSVTVKEPTISITGSNTVAVNGKTQLTASVSPSTITGITFTWSIDNTSIATVDTNGLVTGVAAGTANITASATINGKTVTGTIQITVTA